MGHRADQRRMALCLKPLLPAAAGPPLVQGCLRLAVCLSLVVLAGPSPCSPCRQVQEKEETFSSLEHLLAGMALCKLSPAAPVGLPTAMRAMSQSDASRHLQQQRRRQPMYRQRQHRRSLQDLSQVCVMPYCFLQQQQRRQPMYHRRPHRTCLQQPAPQVHLLNQLRDRSSAPP